MLSMIPIVLALLTSVFVLIAFTEDRSVAQNSCRRELLRGLGQVSPLLQSVLSLNPEALSLRQQHAAAVKRLQAAMATGQPKAIALAKAWLTKIKLRQSWLDQRQRHLLSQARGLMLQTQRRAELSLRRNTHGFLKIEKIESRRVRVALRPDRPGLAPVYVMPSDFSDQQALALRWQSHFRVSGVGKAFLPTRGHVAQVCAATLETKEFSWFPRLIEDRFWSKAFSSFSS